MRMREFTAPNGVKRKFWFRDGTNDESTVIACFEEDYYQVATEGLKAGDVVIDLGAHIGGVTLMLSTIPGLNIIAVEALPENLYLLNRNIIENDLDIKVYDKAIWSRSNEEVTICYGDDSESGKVHRFVGTIGTPLKRDSFTAKTTSLLSIFRQEKIKNCRWLKTDIEGAENQAIGEAPKHILKRIEVLKGEYHGGDYHQLLEKTHGIFKDITPPEMNPDPKALYNFKWRRKHSRK